MDLGKSLEQGFGTGGCHWLNVSSNAWHCLAYRAPSILKLIAFAVLGAIKYKKVVRFSLRAQSLYRQNRLSPVAERVLSWTPPGSLVTARISLSFNAPWQADIVRDGYENTVFVESYSEHSNVQTRFEGGRSRDRAEA